MMMRLMLLARALQNREVGQQSIESENHVEIEEGDGNYFVFNLLHCTFPLLMQLLFQRALLKILIKILGLGGRGIWYQLCPVGVKTGQGMSQKRKDLHSIQEYTLMTLLSI